jgi:hypothetical protein
MAFKLWILAMTKSITQGTAAWWYTGFHFAADSRLFASCTVFGLVFEYPEITWTTPGVTNAVPELDVFLSQSQTVRTSAVACELRT